MNPGELGADIDFGVPPPGSNGDLGDGAPPSDGTFNDKFLAFRGLLLGEFGLSLFGLDESPLKLVKRAGGDSGEVPGVLSSAMADSSVETVVVGDVLLLDEADVDTLLCGGRCRGNGEVTADNTGFSYSCVCRDPDMSVSVLNIDINAGAGSALITSGADDCAPGS